MKMNIKSDLYRRFFGGDVPEEKKVKMQKKSLGDLVQKELIKEQKPKTAPDMRMIQERLDMLSKGHECCERCEDKIEPSAPIVTPELPREPTRDAPPAVAEEDPIVEIIEEPTPAPTPIIDTTPVEQPSELTTIIPDPPQKPKARTRIIKKLKKNKEKRPPKPSLSKPVDFVRLVPKILQECLACCTPFLNLATGHFLSGIVT